MPHGATFRIFPTKYTFSTNNSAKIVPFRNYRYEKKGGGPKPTSQS